MPGVSGANLCFSKFTRQGGFLFACFVLSALLNGCGGSTSSSPSASNAPQTAETSATDNGMIAPLTGAAPPPDAQTRPLKPGQSNRPVGADGLPQLQAKGINYEQLFTERIGDDNKRFDRLENAVLDMRRDFESVLPSVVRLVAVEKDIQNLVTQLETLLQAEPLPPGSLPANPVPPMIEDLAPEPGTIAHKLQSPLPQTQPPAQSPPVASPPEQTPQESDKAEAAPASLSPPTAPAATTAPLTPAASGTAVSALRFGGEGGKTRIVFDANAALTYRTDLDNTENLLVIELPGTSWSAPAQGRAPATSAIESWSAQADGQGGTRLVIILKKPVVLAYQATLKPESDTPHHRLVIDLTVKP